MTTHLLLLRNGLEVSFHLYILWGLSAKLLFLNTIVELGFDIEAFDCLVVVMCNNVRGESKATCWEEVQLFPVRSKRSPLGSVLMSAGRGQTCSNQPTAAPRRARRAIFLLKMADCLCMTCVRPHLGPCYGGFPRHRSQPAFGDMPASLAINRRDGREATLALGTKWRGKW